MTKDERFDGYVAILKLVRQSCTTDDEFINAVAKVIVKVQDKLTEKLLGGNDNE